MKARSYLSIQRQRFCQIPIMNNGMKRAGLFFLTATILFAQATCRRPRPPGPPPHPGERFDRMLEALGEDLDLNESQAAEVENLRRGFRERQRAMERSRRAHMEKIIDLVRQEHVSLEEARALDQEMEDRHREQKEFVLNGIVRIHASLTPRQRKRLADRLESIHQRRMAEIRELHGHPPPDGPPPPPFGPDGPPPEGGEGGPPGPPLF